MSDSSPALSLSTAALQNNDKVVHFVWITISLAAGVACGILGLIGLQGVFGYLIAVACSIGVIRLKLAISQEKDSSQYFESASRYVTAHLFQSMLTFILFWTLCYNIVYVYE